MKQFTIIKLKLESFLPYCLRGLKILFSNIPKGKPTLYIMEGENKMMKYMSGKIIYTNSMDKIVFVNYQDSSQLICC